MTRKIGMWDLDLGVAHRLRTLIDDAKKVVSRLEDFEKWYNGLVKKEEEEPDGQD